MDNLSSTTPYASGHTRAQITTYLLVVMIILNVVAVLSSYLEIGMLSESIAGEIIDENRATMNDVREVVVGLLGFVLYITTAVAFLMWIHRAYRNLEALGTPRQHLEYSPGWAVGYFFIPILSLFMPYRVVKEIWKRSDPEVDASDMFSVESGTPSLLAWWWGLWVLSNIASQAVLRLSLQAETAEALLRIAQLNIVASIIEIIAAVLAIRVVKAIDTRQEARSHRVTFLHAPPLPTSLPATPQPLVNEGFDQHFGR